MSCASMQWKHCEFCGGVRLHDGERCASRARIPHSTPTRAEEGPTAQFSSARAAIKAMPHAFELPPRDIEMAAHYASGKPRELLAQMFTVNPYIVSNRLERVRRCLGLASVKGLRNPAPLTARPAVVSTPAGSPIADRPRPHSPAGANVPASSASVGEAGFSKDSR